MIVFRVVCLVVAVVAFGSAVYWEVRARRHTREMDRVLGELTKGRRA